MSSKTEEKKNRSPKSIKVVIKPPEKIPESQRPSFFNISFVFFTNTLKLSFSSLSFSLGVFTKKATRKTDIIAKKEIAKKGINHKIAAKAAPNMGLTTFPNVFEFL